MGFVFMYTNYARFYLGVGHKLQKTGSLSIWALKDGQRGGHLGHVSQKIMFAKF